MSKYQRGVALMSAEQVQPIIVLRWKVPSETHPEDNHYIYWEPSSRLWRCSCPDFTFRGAVVHQPCKHITALLARSAAEVFSEAVPVPVGGR